LQDDFPVIWLHEASHNVPGLAWVHRVGARHMPEAQEHVKWHHSLGKKKDGQLRHIFPGSCFFLPREYFGMLHPQNQQERAGGLVMEAAGTDSNVLVHREQADQEGTASDEARLVAVCQPGRKRREKGATTRLGQAKMNRKRIRHMNNVKIAKKLAQQEKAAAGNVKDN